MTAAASGSAELGQPSAPSGSQFVTVAEAQQAAEHPSLARARECHSGPAAAAGRLPHAAPCLQCHIEPQHTRPPSPLPSPGTGTLQRGSGLRAQKAYEFAVDVAAGPPDSMFRRAGP